MSVENFEDNQMEYKKDCSQSHNREVNDDFKIEYEKFIQECEKSIDLGLHQNH